MEIFHLLPMLWSKNMEISPSQYEEFVKSWFDENFGHLESYESKIRTKEESHDGEYEIDIKAKFNISGLTILLLVECKKHKNNIKREVAQVLHSKMKSLGAQKGAICTTSGFQSGTLEYCKKHGIACIHMAPGETNFHVRSMLHQIAYDPCEVYGIPRIIGWLETTEGSSLRRSLVSNKDKEYIQKYLKP